MDGTGSHSSHTADFNISGVETSGSASRGLFSSHIIS
jgi:hypothetical protein